MNLPLLRLHPIYPGQWGVPGSDNELGIRSLPQSTVLYVDYDNAPPTTITMAQTQTFRSRLFKRRLIRFAQKISTIQLLLFAV